MTVAAQSTTSTPANPANGGGAVTAGNAGAAAAANAGETKQPGTTTTDNQGGEAKSETTKAEGAQTESGEGANNSPSQGATKEESASEFVARLPDGFEADEATLKEFGNEVKAAGLKGEVAQKFVDLHVKLFQKHEEKRLAEETNQAKEWEAAVTSDKELGGDNLPKTKANIERVMKAFGSEKLTEFFRSRYGNYPPLVEFVSKLGAAMAKEDSIAGTQHSATGGAPDEESVLRNRYPSMYPKNE